MGLLLFSLWVRSITIVGDSLVSEKEIRSAMLLKTPHLFRKSKFHPEILSGDVEAIRTVYLSHGFLSSKIASQYEVDSTGAVDITIEIDEGDQIRVGKIYFRGNQILTTNRLLSLLKTRVGEPFNPLALEEDYLAISARYDQLGYHDARVRSCVSIDSCAEITYIVEEGKRIYVARIELRAKRVKEGRLKPAIGIKVGDILTRDKMIKARQRLYDLGIFARVRLREETLEIGRGLIFDLEPRPPIHLGLRVGYSTLDGPQATLSCEHRNLFRSLRRLKLIGKLSYNEIGSEINYRDPITFNHWLEHGFGFRIERRDEIGYRVSRLGLYGLLNPKPFSFRYDIERVTVSEVEIETLVTPGSEWLRTLSILFRIDTRDYPIRPTTGMVAENRVGLTGILPRGRSNFVKEELRLRRYLPWRGSVIALRCDLGLAHPVRPTTEIPIHERFFLGGATTIRGYGERLIGPKDREGNPLGGERYLLISLEERLPIIWQLGCAFFFDFGSLSQRLDDEELKIDAGIGFGLRLYTPLGPIRLDYGRTLEGGGRLHFAIGEAF